MTKENPYREGDAPTGDEKLQAVPITAFLVLMHANGTVDLVPNLPGFPVQREPTSVDMRNMCQAVASDVQMRLVAAQASGGISKTLSSVASTIGMAGGLAGIAKAVIPDQASGMTPQIVPPPKGPSQ